MLSPPPPVFIFILLLFSLYSFSFSTNLKSTIIFKTNGRTRYNFDIFSLSIIPIPSSSSPLPQSEVQLTDGVSVNYNGFFTSNNFSSSSLLFVSERHGVSNIYLSSSPSSPLLKSLPSVSMKDRPSLSKDTHHLIFVSTPENPLTPRQSWAAVYSTHLPTGHTRRLTPQSLSDLSPSLSPSGEWTAVASYGPFPWPGDIEDLHADIYIFRTADGSSRTKLIHHAGWPCWADDDSTLYFHRRSDQDSWWSVYQAKIIWPQQQESEFAAPAVHSIRRITPPGFHAFTPSASAGLPGVIAIATRRADSDFRHIELVHLRDSSSDDSVFVEVSKRVAPHKHHYNPFISPDGTRIGYHRCRGGDNGSPALMFEGVYSPFADEFSLIRFDGAFPSFSPDGKRIAFVALPGLYVVNSDGTGQRKLFDWNAFPTAWDWKRKGVIYTSRGPDFGELSDEVHVVSVAIGDGDGQDSDSVVKKLTVWPGNNAFPSPSPDGKWVVFRSGRSGYKNLYVMDAEQGEAGGIYRLTEGPWTDTMCIWSPDGEWIAFTSDRDDPSGESFAIYMVHPDGNGLRKVVHSGDGGRTNHPWFSPDSKQLVFTSDFGGVSAEPVSVPHQFQPYGEIYTVNIDGTDIRRLTHNSYEDGTPTWTPFYLKPFDVAEHLEKSEMCSFDDCHWLDFNYTYAAGNVLAGTACGMSKSY